MKKNRQNGWPCHAVRTARCLLEANVAELQLEELEAQPVQAQQEEPKVLNLQTLLPRRGRFPKHRLAKWRTSRFREKLHGLLPAGVTLFITFLNQPSGLTFLNLYK